MIKSALLLGLVLLVISIVMSGLFGSSYGRFLSFGISLLRYTHTGCAISSTLARVFLKGAITETNTASENTNQQTEYAVGDTIKISDYTMTVNKVERNWQSPADYDTPESGKEYVLAEVTITNEGQSSISYNTFDFKMQDSDGVQKSEAITMSDNKLNSGDLAPAGKVTGNLVFEVPKDDAGLKLLYSPTFWGKTVTVNL